MTNNERDALVSVAGYRYSEDRKCLVGPDGADVALRARSLAVFCYLAEHANKVVSKDAIIASVWLNLSVTDDSLVQCIADIRRALDDTNRTILRTIPRQGYMLVSDEATRADSPIGVSENPLCRSIAPVQLIGRWPLSLLSLPAF